MNGNDNLIYKKLGELIKDKRKQRGLSQQLLSDLIPKLDRAKISDMENGKEDFYFSTLIKICNALETEFEIVLKDKQQK